ncbi:MAG: hypothetical protein KDI43_17075 [Gammaproteobacteria bacterium]|nr:hypothetical protein [Gammaproteobacteria bacterium]
MKSLNILTLLILLLAASAGQGKERCQCTHKDWVGDCKATVEFKGNWFKVISDTRQCSRVDWYIGEDPKQTIVIDGAEMEEWPGQAEPPQLIVQSCKICKDANYSDSVSGKSESNKQCSYRFADIGQRPDGIYTGQCLDGKAHGSGSISYDNGETFQGAFRTGIRHGHGVATFPDGTTLKGEFRDGYIHKGIETWANGASYRGEFKNNKPHGQGTMTYANGDRHKGEYRDGLGNGQGTLFESDGDRLVGYWRNGKLWNGTVYTSQGDVCWVNNHNISGNCEWE